MHTESRGMCGLLWTAALGMRCFCVCPLPWLQPWLEPHPATSTVCVLFYLQLRASDPVPNASLRDALRGALERARTALGAALDAGLSGLDPTLGKQLHGMLASTSAPAPL